MDGVQPQTVGSRSFEDRGHPEVWPRAGRNVSAVHPKASVGRVQPVPQGRWRQQQRMNPDTAREMAQSTVTRLEKALEAMGDVQGPAVEVLKTELTKAKSASKQPPLDVEIDQCRKYIARGERRIKELDAQRAEECALLTEAQERLERLVHAQSRVSTVVHPPDSGEQVTTLQQMVNMFAIRARCSCEGVARSQMWGRRSRHSSCGEETSRCEAGRFTTRSSVPDPYDAPVCAERCDELVARSPSRTARGFVAGRFAARDGLGQSDGRRRGSPHRDHESAAFISCQHDRVVNLVTHQCGFVGCRVGEASNPGPVQIGQARRLETALDSARHPGPTSRRRRRRALPWSWESDTESDTDPGRGAVDSSNPGPVLTRERRAEACYDTHIDVSSDEEPLVRPNMGRDVVARTEASGACNAECIASDETPGRDVLLNDRQTLETTQPATPVVLRTAGAITNTERGATMPASPGRSQQILPFGHRFRVRFFHRGGFHAAQTPIQIGVGVTERPGDGSCHGARTSSR